MKLRCSLHLGFIFLAEISVGFATAAASSAHSGVSESDLLLTVDYWDQAFV